MLTGFGFPRDGRRYFVGNPRTVEEGIQIAEDALKNCRRGFVRAEIKDVFALYGTLADLPPPPIDSQPASAELSSLRGCQVRFAPEEAVCPK